MIGKDDSRRKFSQCFFLAPQEKGYFVLNDAFRYVDEKGIEMPAHDTLSPVHPDTGNCLSCDLILFFSFF